MVPTVSDICTKKVISIDISFSISDAIQMMIKHNIHSILITENDTENYFILTTNHTIEYKINNLPLETRLSDLKLQKVQKLDAKVTILEVTNAEQLIHEYFIILNQNKVIGILSQTDIINNIDPQMLLKQQPISSIMLQYTVQTVYEDEATINAIKIMKDKNIDSVIIVNNADQPLGIFTTKDFLNILNRNVDLNLPIKNYMSSPLETLTIDVKIYEALEFIKIKNFKRIVVTNEENKISGVITQKELLRLINNKWMEIIKDRGNKLSKINEELMQKTNILEEKASRDFLTELYNRRKFDSLLAYEIEQIKLEEDGNLSMILLDIDNFKNINDTYGHDIGDEVLKETSLILKKLSRGNDIVARWGGEEFALALSHTTIADALLVAEKLRATIENNLFSNNLKITCSFGVSQFRTTDSTQDLFKRADEALYRAKHSGKNKVVIVSY